MIEKQTTLILGAGASAPFGFPTGYELLRRVIAWADVNPGQTNPNLFSEFGKAEINEFREALEKSGKVSVDSFLEHRPEFIPIGKKAMAMALIQREHQPHLFQRDGKSWYEYLFKQLDAPFDRFGENQLSILTFNYDRSLEHFIFTALKNSSGKSDEECAEKLKSIAVIHLHGDLGELPHFGNTLVRPYNSEITQTTLQIATERIKIVHESAANEPQFEQARHILSASVVICFLGFGYHPANVERIGIRNRIPNPRGKHILGTSFDLTSAEADQASKRCGFNLRPTTHDYRSWDVLQFLRESGALHSN
jgi:hypothetical protein